MTIVEMLEQSAVLTLLGMGVVFGFLVIMIISITLAGKFIHALGLDKDVMAPLSFAAANAADRNEEVTSIITAVINTHRNKG